MRVNLYIKITVLCLGLVLFTGLTLFYISNTEIRSSLESQLEENLENKSKYIINNVDRFIYERKEHIEQIASDPIISQSISDTSAIIKRLREIESTSDLYISFSFFNMERIRLVDTKAFQSIGTQHPLNKYWLKRFEQQTDFIMDISISESLGQPVMHFTHIVRDDSGKDVGVVVSRVLIENLYNAFTDVIDSPDLENKLAIDLLDPSGVILYSNTNPKAVMIEKYAQFSMLEEQINDNSEKEVGSFRQNEDFYFYSKEQGYLSYKGSDWTIVMHVPETIVYQPASELLQRLFLNFITIIVIAIVLSLLFAHYLSRPIILLSRLAVEYGKGNFDANIQFKSRDERQVLANRLRDMAKQLKFKIDEQTRLNEELNHQIGRIETQRTRIQYQKDQITDSIEYAERIQHALLPQTESIQEFFPDSFVIFKPLHLVSGDFFWCEHIHLEDGSEKIVVAMIDCTGHGVPGAFMSIIANNLFHQVVSVEKETSPTKILAKVNEELKLILKGKGNDELKDGMDLALCVIDIDGKYLEFSGANRPMTLIRDNDLILKKGDRWSLGSGINYINRETRERIESLDLSCARIELQPNDCLYLFSDGITDQFGGVENKKYGLKQLVRKLGEIQPMNMQLKYEVLSKEFIRWQKGVDQIDDMLLICINLNSIFENVEIAKVES